MTTSCWPTWAAFAGAVLLYACFLLTEPARLRAQRAAIQTVRDCLAQQGGFVHLARSGEGWDNRAGTRITAAVWVVCLALISSAALYEGMPHVAANIAVALLIYSWCLYTEQSHLVLRHLTRLCLFQQAVAIWYYQAQVSTTLLRRTSLSRTICTLIFFESLEEAVLHAIFLAVMIELRCRDAALEGGGGGECTALVLLPIKMFFLAVLPMHVLGISEVISFQASDRDFSLRSAVKFLKGLRFFSCAIPMQLMLSTFMLQPAARSPQVFGCMVLAVGVALRVRGVDAWIQPHTIMFCHHHHRAATQQDSSQLSHQRSLLSSWLGVAACVPETPAVERVVIAAVISVAFAVACMWHRSPAGIVAVESLAVMVVLARHQLRCGLFSEVQSSLCLITGTGLVVAAWDGGGTWLSSMLSFLCLASSLLALVLACSGEVVYTRMARENDVENFLAHAIKQKFASLGSTVEQLIGLLDGTSPSLGMLRTVLKECRIGHARCHASTVCRRLEQGERRPASSRTLVSLRHELQNTVMAHELGLSSSASAVPAVAVRLDWELLHLALTKLAQRGFTILQVRFTPGQELERGVLGIQLSSAAAGATTLTAKNRVLGELVRELGGVFREDWLELSVDYFGVGDADGGDASLSSPLSTPRATPPPPRAVLSTLRFALVDDNALIRKNFERLLVAQLGVPRAHVLTRGHTRAECFHFVHEICALEVDVAVFDQNLDFDNDDDENNGDDNAAMLKGSDLAQRAHAAGYRGCLVLHSSDANLTRLLERGVFHSAVEKSADVTKFADGLVACWNEFERQRQQQQQQEQQL